MTGSCCSDAPAFERTKVDVAPAPKETTTEQPANIQKSEGCEKQAKNEKRGCGCEMPRLPGAGSMTQLPIVWQRLVITDGRTCPRCDATSQHLQSAVAKLKEVLKPLNVEPILDFREVDEGSFRKEPGQSNRIWIAGKPLEEWLGASVGSSTCCSVCGDAPCRTMEVEGAVYEEIPEALIVKAGLIAASGLIEQTC